MRKFQYKHTFSELVNSLDCNSIKKIPYVDLLQTREWFVKRIEILDRDDFFCTECGYSLEHSISGKGIYLYSNKNSESICSISGITELEEGYKVKNYSISKLSYHPIYLHVHHKYYVEGKVPWDYPNESLVTMCSECHFKWHQNNQVEYYSSDGNLIHYTPCFRCNGAGLFPEFKHVNDGICFRCEGKKFEELL